MTTPLISVALMSYNRPKTLGAAIEGILGQTYANLEIFIGDNASPASEVDEIIRRYAAMDSRIKYTRHAKNLEVKGNCSFLRSQLSGKYHLFCCDDDVYYPTFIEKMYELHQTGTFAVAAAQCECVDEHSGQTFKAMCFPESAFQANQSKEDSFFRYLEFHHFYFVKGPLFIWGLYNAAATFPAYLCDLGFLEEELSFMGGDHMYTLANAAHGGIVFSSEVLWRRQERFYWGPGHEPWPTTAWGEFKCLGRKVQRNLQYSWRMATGQVNYRMNAIETYCLWVRKLVALYGFDPARCERVLGKVKRDLIYHYHLTDPIHCIPVSADWRENI